jgi:hypothetical protein
VLVFMPALLGVGDDFVNRKGRKQAQLNIQSAAGS